MKPWICLHGQSNCKKMFPEHCYTKVNKPMRFVRNNTKMTALKAFLFFFQTFKLQSLKLELGPLWSAGFFSVSLLSFLSCTLAVLLQIHCGELWDYHLEWLYSVFVPRPGSFFLSFVCHVCIMWSKIYLTIILLKIGTFSLIMLWIMKENMPLPDLGRRECFCLFVIQKNTVKICCQIW